MRRDVDGYAKEYRADYGFESIAVAYRHRLVLEHLRRVRPRVVVEIGCGSDLLYQAWLDEAKPVDSWVIVEPAGQFADTAHSSGLPNLEIVRDYFEDSVDRIRGLLLPQHPDIVICSSLLHEVPSSRDLISAAHALMGPETIFHVNVPNSESLHRRLAKARGLVSETKALSARNRALMQHRVYDMAELRAELSGCGLRVLDCGGYLTKPCTHRQMERVSKELGAEALDRLFELGKQLPDSASEIWVEAERDDSG